MKGQTYRQNHPNQPCDSQQSSQFLNGVLDQRLHYLNRSFQHNLKIQEIYLDIIKHKKTIHAKQLKEYYNIFTNSKAQSLMFGHEVHQTQNMELNHTNKEMAFSLKRLYCRLIQKIMLKISYYLMNKPSLNFAYTYASELIKRCETLMRRLNHLKDLNNMNEVIDKIFQQNQEFQEHILNQLINHGYINSVDQFYRINGIDLDHRQIYQRNQEGEEEEEPQQTNIQKKIKFKVKYEAKLLMNSSFKKQIKPINDKNINHRVGMIDNAAQRQIQAKYKDLIISLDKLISSESFSEIEEVKETEQKDEGGQVEQQIPKYKIANQNNESQSSASATSKYLPQTQILERKPIIRQLSHARTIIRRRDLSKQSQQQQYQQQQSKSQLHRKQITIQSLNSSSIIPDVAVRGERSRGNTRKYSSPFSRSFVNAIKSIEKINLIDQSSRLTAKRMSEHIIQFHKQSQFKDPLTSSQNSTIKNKKSPIRSLKNNNHNKSIIKLLNIYKNRTLQEFIGQAQKGIFDNAKYIGKDQIKQGNTFKLTKRTDIFDKENINGFRLSQKQTGNFDSFTSQDHSLQKYSIFKKRAKQSKFKTSSKKLKHLQQLKSQLTENQLYNKSNGNSSQKKKHPTKTSIFQNFRLSQKISLGNLLHKVQNRQCSLNTSPQRPLQSASILTANGIQSVDPHHYNLVREKANKVNKMNKTVDISPTQTPAFPNFQIYDRIRRVIIK